MALVGRSNPTRNGRTGGGWKLEGRIHNGAKKRGHATANIRHLATSRANPGAYPIDRLPDRCGSFFKKTEREREIFGWRGRGERGREKEENAINSVPRYLLPPFIHSLTLNQACQRKGKVGWASLPVHATFLPWLSALQQLPRVDGT